MNDGTAIMKLPSARLTGKSWATFACAQAPWIPPRG